MKAETKSRRRRWTVGANAYPEPTATGPAALTPEEDAENAATQALIRAFGAVVDCGKLAPLAETICMAMEALAFAAGSRGNADLKRRIGEMKAELMWATRD